MIIVLIGFIASFFGTWSLVQFSSLGGRRLLDDDLQSVQKNHVLPVPRIGGVAIFCAYFACAMWATYFHTLCAHEISVLLACSLPAFGAGLIEDVTKHVTPRMRMLCAIAAAYAPCLALHAVIQHVDLPGMSSLLSLSIFAVGFTVLAVAGLTHSINIIDGFNGLASMVAMTIFASIAWVSVQVNDPLVLLVALSMIGAIMGFWLWNFPRGAIFLGDGGAYFIGFMLAESVVLLIARHPSVSPGYSIVGLYPLFETLFSIYRRTFVRGASPSAADGVHLHTLLYRRIVLIRTRHRHHLTPQKRNAATSPYLWVLNLFAVVPATLFWNDSVWLLVSAIAFIVIYVAVYGSIVKFRTPKMLFWWSSGSTLTDGLIDPDGSSQRPPSVRG